MTDRLPVPELPALQVNGGPDFPVRRVFCVGRNYSAHAHEMGSDEREPPFHFIKSIDAVVSCEGVETALLYPPMTSCLHHEVELVLALGPRGEVYAHGVGVDLTRRDLQAKAKSMRRPWSSSKDFDAAAPVGRLVLGPPPTEGMITLSVNGQLRQHGDLRDMIWPTRELIGELRRFGPLRAGDLVFTGTPAGVSPVVVGDQVHAVIPGAHISFRMV